MINQYGYLLVLLAVAATALVQAQKPNPLNLTTNRVVSDGNSSRTTDVNSAGSAIRKLFICATNQNTTKNNI